MAELEFKVVIYAETEEHARRLATRIQNGAMHEHDTYGEEYGQVTRLLIDKNKVKA